MTIVQSCARQAFALPARAPELHWSPDSCCAMRSATSSAESRAVLREIGSHVIAGCLCFAVLAVLAFTSNYAGIGAMFRNDAPLALSLGFAALGGFAPLVICVAVGSVRRGQQVSVLPSSGDEDRPLA